MKKIITDEKFYITDIPKDYASRIKLANFLGLSFNSYWIASNTGIDTLSFDYKKDTYLFIPKKIKNHTVITYDDLLANYLPKNTKVEPLEFKALDEVVEDTIKEDYRNEHYKAQKIDTVARCKANMTLEQQKAICIFNIDRYLHREKKQNLSDIKKIKYYTNWLEEIEKELL